MPLPKEQYNSKDYWFLPEGTRAELIDGQFYNMAALSRIHQKSEEPGTAYNKGGSYEINLSRLFLSLRRKKKEGLPLKFQTFPAVSVKGTPWQKLF
jgi:hypothetical protein